MDNQNSPGGALSMHDPLLENNLTGYASSKNLDIGSQLNMMDSISVVGDDSYLCHHHHKPFETYCSQDMVLMCIECAKNEHRQHDKIHVTDLVFKMNERLQKQTAQLGSVLQFIQASNIAQFEKSLMDSIRSYFKRIHEILYELENKKTGEVEDLLKQIFGMRISVDEVLSLEGIGQKHQEQLQNLISKNKFVYIVKEYQNKLNSYLKEIETINTQASQFLQLNVDFKKEWSSEIVKYSVSDMDFQLSNLVNEVINLNKLESHFFKQQKTSKKGFILKDPAQYQYQKCLQIHGQEISTLTQLQNGNFATGSLDSTIKIWEVDTERILSVFDGHTHSVKKVIELANGNLASCSLDKTINLWDRHTGDIINTLEGFSNDIKDIQELDKDNIAIVIDQDNQFMVWNHKKELEDNLNKKYIYSASNDATIKRWYPRGSGQTSEMTYSGHQGPVTDIVQLDNKHMASSSADKTIKIWEIPTKWCLYTLEGHQRPVTTLLFIGGDQQKIISASLDETIRVWSRESRVCLKVLENGSKARKILYLGVQKVYTTKKTKDLGKGDTQGAGQKQQQLVNDLSISDDSEEDEVSHGSGKVGPSQSSRVKKPSNHEERKNNSPNRQQKGQSEMKSHGKH
eukprot:403353644